MAGTSSISSSRSGDGRAGEWLVGSVAIVIAAALGVLSFNDASFDESMNAASEIPTMAAVFWALVCFVAFCAVSVKRLADAGRGRWDVIEVCLFSLLLVLGWAVGFFPKGAIDGSRSPNFLGLIAALLPALVLCAIGRGES